MTHTPNPTCEHGISWQIQPPDEQGWMKESCGSCEQVLRWTLWPHHQRAVEALADRGDGECACATCADDRRRALAAGLDELLGGDRAEQREALRVLDEQQLQQLQEGAQRLAADVQAELVATEDGNA